MSVAVDAVSSSDISAQGVTSLSGTPITATASATAVLASLVLGDTAALSVPTGVTVKWAAQTLSIVPGADTGFLTGATNKNRSVLYGIGSPTTGAQTLSVTWTNTYAGYVNVMSWKGSDTTTPFKNGTTATATSTAPSVSVTSPTGDFAVGCVFSDTQGFSTTNQTQWWVDNAQVDNGAANYTAGSGTVTLSTAAIVSDLWGYAACDVQVPTSAVVVRPISAGSDRERPSVVLRAPDEAQGWFVRSPVPVPTSRMVPRTGADVERPPPISRSPDEPPGPFFVRSPVSVPTGFYPPTTGADREHPFPVPRSPDEAIPFFRRSLIVVPTAYPPQTGADRERLPPIGRPPDEPSPFFVRSPSPVPVSWLPQWDGWERPKPVDPDASRISFAFAPPIVVNTIAGMAWYNWQDRERPPPIGRSPDESIPWFLKSQVPVPLFAVPLTGADRERLPPIGRSSDEAVAWFITPPLPPPVVSVTFHNLPFHIDMGRMGSM
jgi:hypothetical protein